MTKRVAEEMVSNNATAMAAVRGTGAGWELMRHAMAEVEQRWPGLPIRIGAQAYLQKFYEGCGFEVVSEPYLEDGIPHLTMVYQSKGA